MLLCLFRTQRQVAELEEEIEGLEEELERQSAAAAEANHARASLEALTAEAGSLRQQVSSLSITLPGFYFRGIWGVGLRRGQLCARQS